MDEHNNHPIGSEPNVVHVTPEQIVKDIKAYMEKMPQVAFIIAISPRNDPGNVSAYGNAGPHFGKEMLRHLIHKLSSGRIQIPYRT